MAFLTKKRWIESITPFGLVILLTLIAFLAAIYNQSGAMEIPKAIGKTIELWFDGFFSLLGFTLQMMMILTLGYSLALFEPVNKFLVRLASKPSNFTQGLLLVALITMVAGLFNWGFGLIIGAILAKTVQKTFQNKGIPSNPGLLAAAGYLGMAIWHGGLSASAPLAVADQNHFLVQTTGVISVEETLFSGKNFVISGGLFLVFVLTTLLLNKFSSKQDEKVEGAPFHPLSSGKEDRYGYYAGIFLILVLVGITFFSEKGILQKLSLNWVIFLLLGLTLFFYKSSERMIVSVGHGLKASSEIFLQFPFYAGILGLLGGSGIIRLISEYLINNTSESTFPAVAFISAAGVNLLIPSGGGQWAIQGEVLLLTAKDLGMNLGEIVLAFAYGDQISNLLQPFWALPLLSITGVPIRKIFPYTFVYFLAGFGYLLLMMFVLF